jgi:trans-2,3-dihydro-3-hydroxyanthranilate isomerase
MRLWAGEAGEPDAAGELLRDFLIADVFTGSPLEGNQLGVFLDGRGLADDLMLKATRELNFSESVFFLPPGDPEKADAHVRIFTPDRELPFAGHPTLGSAWVLGEITGKRTVTIQTGAGLVPVELDRDGGTNAITFGRMSQPIPTWAPYGKTGELIAAIGADPRPDGLPPETYTNGPAHTYIEFPDEAAVAALAPDMQALTRLGVHANCFAQTETGWVTRMFAPGLGVTEDPATGSAAGPLAVHLARHGRIEFGAEIEIHQGAYIRRPSVLYARVEGGGDTVEQVVVGGRAVVVARGEYRLR